MLTPENIERIKALNAIAERRGQSLAQMANHLDPARPARHLRPDRGRGPVAQLKELLAAVNQPALSAEELTEIDQHATEGGVDLWRVSSNLRVDDLPG